MGGGHGRDGERRDTPNLKFKSQDGYILVHNASSNAKILTNFNESCCSRQATIGFKGVGVQGLALGPLVGVHGEKL